MTSFKLLGAALIIASIAAPASAQVSEPAAAESQNPNFSIYSGGGGALGSSRAIESQPFSPDAMAQMRLSARPHRAHRAPIRHY